MAGRVRELVQEDERALAAVDDELLDVVALGRAAEDAAVLLVGGLDVFEAPRRPEAFHTDYSQRLYRKKPIIDTTMTSIRLIVTRKPAALSKPGNFTFMPKKPVMNVSGSITTLKIVSTYRMSFC